jgi:hypothetical protein
MGMYRPRYQRAQILAGTATVNIEVSQSGSDFPENIWVILKYSAMSGTETLDISGKPPGSDSYVTAKLTTQIDVKAAESTVTKLDLSGSGPLRVIKFASANIAAAETIDILVISW